MQELLDSDGWALVEQWLETQDKRINEAIKYQLMSLKSEEMTKWITFYSGESNIILNLMKFVKDTIDRPSIVEKMKEKIVNPFS